jgi:hypothetical protein
VKLGVGCLCHFVTYQPPVLDFLFSLFLERERQQADAKAQEAVTHLASVSSGREEISQPGIERPTSFLRFGYLSTLIQ